MLFADDPGMTGSEIALIITASFGGVATLITAVASSIAAVYLVRVKLLAEQSAAKLETNTNMTRAIAVQQVQTKQAVVEVAANQVKTHEAIASLADDAQEPMPVTIVPGKEPLPVQIEPKE